MTHLPVLLDETIASLGVKPGGRYIDGTLGRAGHAKAIVAAGGRVLGIDRDEQALAEVGEVEGVLKVKGNHGDIAEIAAANGWLKVDGVLLDLGVSSPQLDEAERGFSFMREGPLDMRMDRSRGLTAASLINGCGEEELADIFRRWGEEPQAKRIAKAVVKRIAMEGDFTTTKELGDFVEKLVGRKGARHPATRIFQALRMAVNDEAGELERALDGGLSVLRDGGVFAVITFESLTDRMVKRFFAAHVGREVSLQQGGSRWEGEEPKVRPVTAKAVTASEKELANNPRSRSAKLRAVMRGGGRNEKE